MKSSIVLMIAVISVMLCTSLSNTMAQEYLLDSIIRTNVTMGYGARISQKDVFHYNSDNNVSLQEEWVNIHWFIDSLEWRQTLRSYLTYQTPDELILELREERAIDEEEWVFDYKLEYIYQAYEKVRISYDWEYDQWQPGGRWTNSWSPSMLKNSYLTEYWDEDSLLWSEWDQIDSIFNPDYLSDTVRQFMWLSQGVMDSISEEVFDYISYPDTISSYKHMYNGIDYIIKRFHDPAISADIQLYNQKTPDTNVFLPRMRKLSYFDGQGNMIRKKHQTWKTASSSWHTDTQYEYVFNSLNQLIEYLSYFPGDTTTLMSKKTYAYNGLGLLAEEKYFSNPYNSGEYTMKEYYYSEYYVGNKEIHEDIIKIYPNPASDFIFIKNIDASFDQIAIHSANGQVVYQQAIKNESMLVDISTFNNGTYLIILRSKNKQHCSRFIKTY